MSLRVGVIGASGYVGSELCRWLLAHPSLKLEVVISRSAAGKALAEVVPALLGFSELLLQPLHPKLLTGLDVILLAVPHGAAAGLVDQLDPNALIVDLSADHRHAAGWSYGQPIWRAEALASARRIAAPGCFATALSLSLAPLVRAGVVQGPVQCVAATGSTGSGATPSATTHHPLRAVNLRAYKVLSHQHVPEVRAFLAELGVAPTLHFVPWSAPVDRGILATCFVEVGDADASAIVADAYAHTPLVRLRDGSPELRHVRGSALCDLSVHQQGSTAVVLAALDNLAGGAAAQAIAATNLALGLPVHSGLFQPSATP